MKKIITLLSLMGLLFTMNPVMAKTAAHPAAHHTISSHTAVAKKHKTSLKIHVARTASKSKAKAAKKTAKSHKRSANKVTVTVAGTKAKASLSTHPKKLKSPKSSSHLKKSRSPKKSVKAAVKKTAGKKKIKSKKVTVSSKTVISSKSKTPKAKKPHVVKKKKKAPAKAKTKAKKKKSKTRKPKSTGIGPATGSPQISDPLSDPLSSDPNAIDPSLDTQTADTQPDNSNGIGSVTDDSSGDIPDSIGTDPNSNNDSSSGWSLFSQAQPGTAATVSASVNTQDPAQNIGQDPIDLPVDPQADGAIISTEQPQSDPVIDTQSTASPSVASPNVLPTNSTPANTVPTSVSAPSSNWKVAGTAGGALLGLFALLKKIF